MSSPRPMAPSSSTPATSVMKRTQRVHWMQRVMNVLISGPEVLLFDRALVLHVARAADAVGHRLVLQVALAALVADRAVERMIDEQELHHAFARLLHHRRCGVDDLGGCRPCSGGRSLTPMAQEATGFGMPPSTSTRHMRQLPAIDRRSW